MKALSSLKHGIVLFLHLYLSNLFVTELTAFFIHVSLHLFVIGLSSFSFFWIHEEIHLINIVFRFITLPSFGVGRGIDLHVVTIVRHFLLFLHAYVVSYLILLVHWLSSPTSWSWRWYKHIKQCSHTIYLSFFLLIKSMIGWRISACEP